MTYHESSDIRLKTITFEMDDGSSQTYWIPVDTDDILNDSTIDGTTLGDALMVIRANFAGEFSTEDAYAKDSYICKGGILYKFDTDHAAGAWNASEVTQVSVADELVEIKDDIAKLKIAAGSVIPASILPYIIDENNYFDIMKAYFDSHVTDGQIDFTELCDEWYANARTGWTGGVTFANPATNNVSTGTKTGDNAGLTCVPSTTVVKNRDDYEFNPLFAIKDCNVYLDENGEPHITAIEDICGTFERDNPSKIVGVLQATGWVKYTDEADGGYSYEYTDEIEADGFYPLPEAVKLSDNSVRSWVVHTKYGFGTGYSCCSDQAPLVFTVSHNNQRTGVRSAWSTRYCGYTSADDAFLKLMLYIKYGRLDSDSVLAGCTSYNLDYASAVAETGVERIIVTTAQSANLVVGSTISYGGTARASSQIVDRKKIVSIETVNIGGTDYAAINIDNGGVTFDTTTADHLLTMPWFSGSTDGCLGNDGGQNPTNAKYAVRIQGIEILVGNYVIGGDVILNYATVDSVSCQVAAVCRDATKIAESITSDYTVASYGMPNAGYTADAWKSIARLGHDDNLPELMLPSMVGGSSSQLTRDSYYLQKEGTTGLREWLAFGNLTDGAVAGLSCVSGYYSLASTNWYVGGRLSLTGNRGEWAA